MADTIAAIATGAARCAIGIIRLSGDDAIEVVSRVFTPASGGSIKDAEPGKLVYGKLMDRAGETLDLCLCTISHAPRSYTGENTAELQCHGSPVVLGQALEELFYAGARQALAGEFTKRAFLNGKLDLTGAEAVIDLIDAETAEAAKNASGQLGGAIFKKTEGVYSYLLDLASHFQAVVDYPDEDIEEFYLEEYADGLMAAEKTLSDLYATWTRGKFLKEGVRCAIVGRPNVGKSSLLNALLGYDRAIVTDIAGTTRDTVEEKCMADGVLLRLIDTAGIRETEDTVEKIGVQRSLSAMESAELILDVVDGTEKLTAEDAAVISAAQTSGKPWILVINKTDISDGAASVAVLGSQPNVTVAISAKTGDGIAELTSAIGDMFRTEPVPAGEILTNSRQAQEVLRAKNAVSEAIGAFRMGVTPDAVLTLLEEGMEAMCAISGKSVRDDVVTRIFERFCVGK